MCVMFDVHSLTLGSKRGFCPPRLLCRTTWFMHFLPVCTDQYMSYFVEPQECLTSPMLTGFAQLSALFFVRMPLEDGS